MILTRAASAFAAPWLLFLLYAAHASEPRTGPFLADAAIEEVASGFRFTEGPVWDGERLLFSDVQGDALYALGADGTPVLLQRPTHWANGHTWALDGSLLSAEHGSGEVTRRLPDGSPETLAARYAGRRLNSPNDLVVRSGDGAIFFTDPPFGLAPPYGPAERAAELPFSGVYRIDVQTRRVALLDETLKYPNGIALSPDEQTLYVNDTATQIVWRYDLAPDGSVANRQRFADLSLEGASGVVDGMQVDTEGRLYVTCPGGICVLANDGAPIVRFPLPEPATDIAWGGADLTTLYITGGSRVWKLATTATGTGSGIRRAVAYRPEGR